MNARSLLALLVSVVALALFLAALDVLLAPWLLDMPEIPIAPPTGSQPGLTVPAWLVAPMAAAPIAALGLMAAVMAGVLWRSDIVAHRDELRRELKREPLLEAALQEALDRITRLLLESAPGRIGETEANSARGVATMAAVALDPTRRRALEQFVRALGLEAPGAPPENDAREPGSSWSAVRTRTLLAIVGCVSIGLLAAAAGALYAAFFTVVDPRVWLPFGFALPSHAPVATLVAGGAVALLAFGTAGGLYLLLRREDAARAARGASRRAVGERRLQLFRVRAEDLAVLPDERTAVARRLLAAHARAALVETGPEVGAEIVRALHRQGWLRAGAAVDLDAAPLGHVDLSAEHLARVDLAGAVLHAARLVGCNLAGARLAHAKLEGADLRRADLRAADLTGARLCGARLQHADLRGACLDEADLRGANLWQAQTGAEVPA